MPRIFLLPLIALLSALAPAQKARAPRWLDTKLAGYLLAYDETHGQAGIYDTKTGYHLVRMIECDGSHITVMLTRDRREVSGMGYRVHRPHELRLEAGSIDLVKKPLPSLTTGKGVRIGDSPARVRARLGAPKTVKRVGARKQFVEYTYVWRNVRNGEGMEWENRYVFKANKLIEIVFARDMVPGCGG